ncbi:MULTISPECIES: hypothetical protein [unclassified Streptomyces]|uniref:hypothetical protein n=1 Tax=unclassified Streptomyces TaxID=2593676 RepID=UPI001C59DD2B|nr:MULTISPECIES: hypothetical protein [unclassified Streptomyces]MBW1598291.1 hypothetical protein [Streptomyces sp. JJ38]MCZ7414192.1 hypothetical protein [Streptomyces sp. WMMC897]MCZ7431210.1 hypothetical protein [Streptomyces sp. WMMC1477]
MTMNILSSAPALSLLASGSEEHGGAHASLNPWLIGASGLLMLLLLLWITTRFNRDR